MGDILDNRYYFFKGRVALYSLLKCFGIGEGDLVLLPGYTCVVVPSALVYLGALPIYADINKQSYNSHFTHYERAFKRVEVSGSHPGIKAVIIQHTYGNPNRDTEKITIWARERDMFVIEDCAHVNGVAVEGKSAGTFGDGAFFSTQWSKPFTTGLGGFARLNNKAFSNKMASLQKSASPPGYKETFMLAVQLMAHKMLLYPGLYWPVVNTHRALARKGFYMGSSTPSELEGQMPQDYFKGMGRLQKWFLGYREKGMGHVNSHRKWLAGEYDRLLGSMGLPVFDREEGSVLIRYPVSVKDRQECLDTARRERIELGDWFNHPLHPDESFLAGLNWEDDYCPNAVKLAKNTVNLPMHTRINGKEVRRIVEFIARFIK